MALNSSLWLIYSQYSVEQINKTLKFPSEPKLQHLLIKSSDPRLDVSNRSLKKTAERLLAGAFGWKLLGLGYFVQWVHPFMQRFLNDELKGLLPLLLVHDNHGTHGRRQGTHSEYLSSCWVGSHNVRKTWSLWIL